MKKPETWKDILEKNIRENTVQKCHSWIITGSYSSRSVGVRSISGFSNENPSYEGSYISYKCKKCGMKGKKYIGDSNIRPDEDLSCDEYVIKDILE
jgi:hypothetical protein